MKKNLLMMLAVILFAACTKENVKETLVPATPVPQVTELTKSSAVISWEAIENAVGYIYKLNDGEAVKTADLKVSLTALVPDTEYTFAIQSFTEEERFSEWGNVRFRTQESDFTFDIPSDGLGAFFLKCTVTPKDLSKTYYLDVLSKERWEKEGFEKIIAEKEDAVKKYAEMMQMTYEEALASVLYSGEFEYFSESGFRPDTDYVILAFYWDVNGKPSEEVATHEYHSPAAQPSSESIQVQYSEISQNRAVATLVPSAGVREYYYYFDKKDAVDAMLAELDENAWLSYMAMNKGVKYVGENKVEHPALNMDTEYSGMLMGIDQQGNRFSARYETRTLKEGEVERVESELFTELLGTWTATQTLNDPFDGPSEAVFTVEIVQNVENYDYDYRSRNQLVALFKGWRADIAYYGVEELKEQGIENPEEKFGPKVLLNIAQDDVVTINGTGRDCVVGWMFFGSMYMFNITPDGTSINTETDLDVTVSDDKKTITISSPASLEGYYPGLAYYFDGIGWFSHLSASSNIVLTRE